MVVIEVAEVAASPRNHHTRARGGSNARAGNPVASQRLDDGARARMNEVQRARMLAAAAQVVAERGYSGMSTSRVTARAGVSRRTFYEAFSGREDCFLAVFEEGVTRAGSVARDAAGEAQGWREQVRAGLAALLQFIGDEPVLTALIVVDALGSGPRVLEARARGLETLKRVIDRGRLEIKGGSVPPPLIAEALVGAVLSVIHARLLQERAPTRGELLGLLNPLMAMIVAPYLGAAAARRELQRPVPKARRAPSRQAANPLDGLGLRVTYRTLRVLAVIAAQGERGSGLSNREIAERAGITDPGQVSRLLKRLQRVGLVQNTGLGQARGETNSWTLTTRGVEVEAAVDTRIGR